MFSCIRFSFFFCVRLFLLLVDFFFSSHFIILSYGSVCFSSCSHMFVFLSFYLSLPLYFSVFRSFICFSLFSALLCIFLFRLGLCLFSSLCHSLSLIMYSLPLLFQWFFIGFLLLFFLFLLWLLLSCGLCLVCPFYRSVPYYVCLSLYVCISLFFQAFLLSFSLSPPELSTLMHTNTGPVSPTSAPPDSTSPLLSLLSFSSTSLLPSSPSSSHVFLLSSPRGEEIRVSGSVTSISILSFFSVFCRQYFLSHFLSSSSNEPADPGSNPGQVVRCPAVNLFNRIGR